jgi:aspartyl-tRNA(Asn)/glutamyl-tRNA(Gln) amidotransferase subunit A
LLDEAQTVSSVDYAEALIRREDVRQELAQLLHQHEDALGCLVMPATIGPAPGIDTTGVPTFNAPWSYIGWPSLTIPCALASNGLPIGMQFIAMTAPQVFAMGGLCERILGFHERPRLLETKP